MKDGIFLRKILLYFSAFCSSVRNILNSIHFVVLDKIYFYNM